jgi:hypothetical protein
MNRGLTIRSYALLPSVCSPRAGKVYLRSDPQLIPARVLSSIFNQIPCQAELTPFSRVTRRGTSASSFRISDSVRLLSSLCVNQGVGALWSSITCRDVADRLGRKRILGTQPRARAKTGCGRRFVRRIIMQTQSGVLISDTLLSELRSLERCSSWPDLDQPSKRRRQHYWHELWLIRAEQE